MRYEGVNRGNGGPIANELMATAVLAPLLQLWGWLQMILSRKYLDKMRQSWRKQRLHLKWRYLIGHRGANAGMKHR